MNVRRIAVTLAPFLALCLGAGLLGSFATARSVSTWYTQIAKPSWTPPGAVFGPVWTVLYVAMAVSAWLVWRRLGLRGGRFELGLFAVQLALNAAWSFLFFGLRSPGLAVVGISVLWASIVATMLAFRPVSRPAAWLLAPYLVWVSFAAALNASIWSLNA